MSEMSLISDKLDIAIRDYVDVFCEKQDMELDYWVGGRVGEVGQFGDYFFDFQDIRYDMESDQPKWRIIEWQDYYVRNEFEDISYEDWCGVNEQSLENYIDNYKTVNKRGFTSLEIEELLREFPNINMDKFQSAMRGNTCTGGKGGLVFYHCDVYNALKCGIENRDLTIEEWD